MKKVLIKKDTYFDSVFLMQVTASLRGFKGVSEAQVTMGTAQNKSLLRNLGFSDRVDTAGPNDLVIAVDANNRESFDLLREKIDEMLKAPGRDTNEDSTLRSSNIDMALDRSPDANLAVISVAGRYAAFEAEKALERGLHVMLFSDNVSMEEEKLLKQLAAEKSLLLMGPDCGTAVINGCPLCFANEIRRGPVGVVAASGTGAQEVSVLIDRFGSGCSQVIGTGGRDLSLEIGGLSMMAGIEALAADENTALVVVVSKPPAPEMADRIVKKLETCGKPSVIHFIASSVETPSKDVHVSKTLEDAARTAVRLVNGSVEEPGDEPDIPKLAEKHAAAKSKSQKYVRGYFTGGTLCDEALFILRRGLDRVYSNIHPDPGLRPPDPRKSLGHTLVDLGDDTFTSGRPHPMIEPLTRIERIQAETGDEEIAVVMLDVVLGYGSHDDPAGAVAPALAAMKEAASKAGGNLTILASITGTKRDFQGFDRQKARLEDAGALVLPSNAAMARLALEIMKKVRG